MVYVISKGSEKYITEKLLMVNTLKRLSANSGNTNNFDPSAEEKMLEVERILKHMWCIVQFGTICTILKT